MTGARAILAAVCVMALQGLLFAIGVGPAARAGELGVSASHSLCAAGAGEDGAPAGRGDCGSCLICQRGPLSLGAVLPPSDPLPSVAGVALDAPSLRAFLPRAARRAGRGAGSRAPPRATAPSAA